jgi:hypothetical protein
MESLAVRDIPEIEMLIFFSLRFCNVSDDEFIGVGRKFGLLLF